MHRESAFCMSAFCMRTKANSRIAGDTGPHRTLLIHAAEDQVQHADHVGLHAEVPRGVPKPTVHAAGRVLPSVRSVHRSDEKWKSVPTAAGRRIQPVSGCEQLPRACKMYPRARSRAALRRTNRQTVRQADTALLAERAHPTVSSAGRGGETADAQKRCRCAVLQGAGGRPLLALARALAPVLARGGCRGIR